MRTTSMTSKELEALARACNENLKKRVLAEILADDAAAKLDGRPRLQLVVELDEMIHPWAVRVRKQRKERDGNL